MMTPHPRSFGMARLLCLGAVAVALGAMAQQQQAQASPWVLPKDTTVMQIQYRTEYAEREFLPDGTNQDFPLNGEFSSQSAELTLRRGLGFDLEISLKAVYKTINFSADPIYITAPAEEGSDDANGDGRVAISPIFSFSEQVQGLQDIFLSLRYNAINSYVLVTPEIELKIPSGYAQPEGTFRDDDPGLLDASEAGDVIPTGEPPIGDDFTLGDGQVDLTAQLLLGTFISATQTFARANAGFRLRFNGPGEQVVWGVKIGQLIGKHLAIFAETNGVHTVLTGDSIGTTFATREPDEPAAGFRLEAFELINLNQDRDYIDVAGGFILKFDRYEFIFSGGKIVDGSNIAELIFANLGTVYRF
ncbi:MAG: hypothetical protein AAFS10_13670 [Myxococcota bacterium]